MKCEERISVQRFERYEAAMLGTIFCVLAALMVFLGHGHAH